MSDEAYEDSARILLKSGLRNVKEVRVPNKSVKFIKDLAHTLVVFDSFNVFE